LGFLGSRRLGGEDPDYEGLISLDFLGFSRLNLDLPMGYAEKSETSFSFRFCRRARTVGTASPRLGMRKGRIAHGASLTQFLIFCKILPALIALAVGGRSISSNFRFSVMADLTPAIHENTESGDQVIDNVS
jgi:hypothetical protein